MRLTTKGRYAVTAMMDLALHESSRHRVVLKTIAEHQVISVTYLEQLFAKLRDRGLVIGVRGPGGGYRLTRPASEISVYEIISAVDESVDVTRCHGRKNCQDGEICLTHELWTQLSEQISSFLDNLSLADIVQSERVRTIAERQSILCKETEVEDSKRVVFSDPKLSVQH